MPWVSSIRLAVAVAAGAVVAAPALAQQPGAPQRPVPAQPDPAMEAAQRAFDALPEAERKAIQDDLIWASDFNATLSGSFGPRTYNAIRHFETMAKTRPDGILDDGERKILAEAAKKFRAASRYALVTDAATGSALGLPLSLFTKREPLPIGTLWSSKDEVITVRTGASPGTAADLPRAFEGTLSIQAPGRKVTYKLLRPDFFVVSGEIGSRTFYTRMAPGKTQLVSYTLMFPTARTKEFERVMIALANSFQPVAGTAAPAVASAPQGVPPAPAQATAGTLPAGLILTGVVIAPGKVATDALAASCPDLRVNGKPARVTGDKLAGPATGGVALLDADTGRAPALSPAAAGKWPDAPLVLGFVAGKPGATLNVSAASSIAPANAASPRIEVPLHAEGGGSAVFSRSGEFVGLMRVPHASPRLVAGMVPAATHAVITGDALRKALPAAAPPAGATGSMSAGDIATKFGPSLVAIDCGQPIALPKN